MNELHLFAGAGGGVLAGQLLGHRTVCSVEIDPYARAVLVARQNDGTFPPFPIWDDVSTFDGKPWRGIVDVVSGGFPCQDISVAGRGAGITGERSGLWKEFARIIGGVRPRYAFVENSPNLVKKGLDVVLSDLAEMGYDAEWICLSAAQVGAPHKRERIWILAADTKKLQRNGGENYTKNSMGRKSVSELGDYDWQNDVSDTLREGLEGQRGKSSGIISEQYNIGYQSWWQAEPELGRVADGVEYRADRLKAIGNGQVPLCAATAFRVLMDRLNKR